MARDFQNNNDILIAENSHLKKVNGTLEVEVDQLEREVKQLKEALKKCSPFNTNRQGCWGCGTFFMSEHEESCQYIQLTKDGE